MTYRGFRTREQLGLRPPKSRSTNVRPQDGGVAVHWGGTGNTPAEHAGCEERWRAWQAYHMDTKRWADIAYNFGWCQHGYVLAGRGYGVRSAAQGTDDGNDRYMAAVFVGGQDGPPAGGDAFDALEWVIAECRRLGAGLDVRPHSEFHDTSCCGDHIRGELDQYDGRPVPYPPGPTTEEDGMKATDKVTYNGAAAQLLGVADGHELTYEDNQAYQHALADATYNLARAAAERDEAILAELRKLNSTMSAIAAGGGAGS